MACLSCLALLQNFHTGNIGVIRRIGSETWRAAPLFDYDGSFGFRDDERAVVSACAHPFVAAVMCANRFSFLDPSWDWTWYDSRVLDGFENHIVKALAPYKSMPSNFAELNANMFAMRRIIHMVHSGIATRGFVPCSERRMAVAKRAGCGGSRQMTIWNALFLSGMGCRRITTSTCASEGQRYVASLAASLLWGGEQAHADGKPVCRLLNYEYREIGTYESLRDAFDACRGSGTVQLIRDVETDKEITINRGMDKRIYLDLNGRTITRTNNNYRNEPMATAPLPSRLP